MTSAHEPPDRPPRAAEDAPPTADQLLIMAYVDGELSPAERARVDERCAREPELRAELAGQRRVAVLARELAPREPEDHEWERIARAPLGRVQRFALWTLVLGVPVLSIALLETYCWSRGTSALVRYGVTALVAMFVAAVVTAVVSRLRTRPYDPYTGVRR